MTKDTLSNKQAPQTNDDLFAKIAEMVEDISRLSAEYEANVNQFSKVNHLYADSVNLKEKFDSLLASYEKKIDENSKSLSSCSYSLQEIRNELKQFKKEMESFDENIEKMKECVSLIKEFEKQKKIIETDLRNLSKLAQSTSQQFSEQSKQISKFTKSDIYNFITENNKGDIMEQVVNYVIDNVELYTDGLFGSKKCKLVKK